MNKRQLGKNGFYISEVGLGCWQIGADWGDEVHTKEARKILEQAVANGINFFDTADVYGNGRSETLIGNFIKETNSTIKVATKFGRAFNVFPSNYSEKALRNAVDASRKRLNKDCLDLLQLHCIPFEELKKGHIFDWLRTLKHEGKIAGFGASVESIKEGLLCIEQDELQSLQVIYNIFRQKLTDQLLPQAYKKGVGIIVRLPLASGLLTGKFNSETTFSENDHRNFNKDGEAFNVGETFAGLPFSEGVQLSKLLQTYCQKEMSMVAFALRWILDHKEVTTIIPGASSARQIIENSKASNLPNLPLGLLNELREFYNTKVKSHIRGVY